MGKWTKVRTKRQWGEPGIPELAERGAEQRVIERGVGEAWTRARHILADCLGLLGRLENDVRGPSGRRRTVKGQSRGAQIKKLSSDDVRARLSEFERAHVATTGERLTSAEFYVRFCAGEFDDRFGMRWATFYEAAELAEQNGSAARS
jgi:hypothetical protein